MVWSPSLLPPPGTTSSRQHKGSTSSSVVCAASMLVLMWGVQNERKLDMSDPCYGEISKTRCWSRGRVWERHDVTLSDPQTEDPRASLDPKRYKFVCSKSLIRSCQPEPHVTVGVLAVPFSTGQDIQSLEGLRATEGRSVIISETRRVTRSSRY